MAKPTIQASTNMLILLIILTNIIPPLSIDEYTPSMPHMLHVFGVDASVMQLTITFYLLAFFISQVIGGVLSDRFGRRPVLLATMPLFLIGSLVCIFATNIKILLLGRVLQGLGVGVSGLSGPAIMADSFEGQNLTKASSYYSTVYSFIPISAPIIGGFIQEYFNWQGNFIFMFILAFLIYLIFFIKLPETHQADKSHTLSLNNIVKSYGTVLTNKKYMLAVTCLTLIWSVFMVFSLMAPFIMQNRLGFTPSQYGLLALFVGLGFFVGNGVNNILIKKMTDDQVLRLGLITMVVFSIVLLLLSLMGFFNAWAIMVPIFLIMCGAGFSFPHFYAKAVSAVPQYAGVAGALIGSLILLGAVIITAGITQMHAHSAIDMALVYVILSALCLIVHGLGERQSSKKMA